MTRTIGIGHQDFEVIRKNHYFYVDKTDFIREWWQNGDSVTLITRPRRFGKTLTMSMVEQFFSLRYADRGDLFCGLSIWEDECYRALQGTYPVISLSFANVKENDFEKMKRRIGQILTDLYSKNYFLMESNLLTEEEKSYYRSVTVNMDETTATMAIHQMANFLSRYYGKNVIILLDEYDTPMQEAYIEGYWNDAVSFTRSLFNAAFKTNPYLERAIMTGITRVSKESIFSDLNNLTVVTTTSEMYADTFGFREDEVFAALKEFGMEDKKQEVKRWYDGFTFGSVHDIYNPWSIINYLREKKLGTYWANTSSNSLIGKLIREGSADLKLSFEALLQGETLTVSLDEQIIYEHLDQNEQAIWSLLLASGYLKVVRLRIEESELGLLIQEYELSLTNREVRMMFYNMVHGWFAGRDQSYNDFIKALLKNDLKAMNVYMNKVALASFSYFDSGKKPSDRTEPERFYHGFVLGLLVDLSGRYAVTSNRESGFGRYDVMLEPLRPEDDAMILEFKVFDPEEEKTLEDTVKRALEQIETENYAASLAAKGISRRRIRKYGIAFEGKRVRIGS